MHYKSINRVLTINKKTMFKKIIEMEIDVISVALERIKAKIKSFEDKLDEMDCKNSGEVVIVIDENDDTELTLTFMKVGDVWGAMREDDSWEPFKNIPERVLDIMYGICESVASFED